VLAVNTTVIAVVGPDGTSPLEGVQATNVRVLRTDPDASALDRAVTAWEQARRTAAPYLLHDADPLAWVADAWTRRFEGSGVPGDLEVAVAETSTRWRTRSLDLPDYYLVADPESFSATLRHWYFGVLGSAAPTRVVALSPSGRVVDDLPSLRTGPWWPALDRILADVDRLVPDQVGQLAAPAGRPGLVLTGTHPGPRLPTDEQPSVTQAGED
jgi:hypothetical protein